MASKNSAKIVKAQEVETKEELRQSKIDRYLPVIQKAQATLSKANVDKLKASVAIGKALIELKPVFDNSKEFEAWAEETVSLKRAQIHNMMKLANPKNKAVLDEAIKEEIGPTDTLKKMTEANKDDGKPKGKKAQEPEFDYTIKRASAELAKPGDGTMQEIANQLFEAVDSIIDKHDQGQRILELLMAELEEKIFTPKETAKDKLAV